MNTQDGNLTAPTTWQRHSKMAIDAMTPEDWKFSIESYSINLKRLSGSLECCLSVVQAKKRELGL